MLTGDSAFVDSGDGADDAWLTTGDFEGSSGRAWANEGWPRLAGGSAEGRIWPCTGGIACTRTNFCISCQFLLNQL